MPARGGNHRSSGAIFFIHEAPASVSGGPQVPRGGVVGPGRVLGRGFDPRGALRCVWRLLREKKKKDELLKNPRESGKYPLIIA